MAFADLVIQNGPIITMNSKRKIFEAVAVRGGKIIVVGSKPEVKRLIGPQTEVVDLKGRTCTPGLVDTHDHFLQQGISSAFFIDIRYPKAKSIKEIVAKLDEHIKNVPKGQWVIAHVWDETLLEEKRFPTKHDLDPISPDNPVFIK